MCIYTLISFRPDSSAPPLPPHGIQLDMKNLTPDEYRPPVPPHRTSQPPIVSGRSTPHKVQNYF